MNRIHMSRGFFNIQVFKLTSVLWMPIIQLPTSMPMLVVTQFWFSFKILQDNN